MPLGPNDILLPHYSLPTGTFPERCAAALAGGFAALGVHTSVHHQARATGLADADILRLVGDAGLRVAQLEAAVPLGDASGADAFTAEMDHCLELAELFGADHIHVVVVAGDPDDQVRRFADACDRAASQGVRLGIEFIPTVARLRDVAETLTFVERVERENAGLVIDAYHHFRGSDDWDQLESLSGSRVVSIQFDDAAVPPVAEEYVTDTMHHRRPPGEGDFDLVRFVRTMDAIGATAPYSVEVLSDELSMLAPEEVGRRLGRAARLVLAEARS